jgi:hypothetical protein
MPQPTWTLSIKDIVTNNVFTDVSSYLLSASWSLGFGASYEPMARESTLTVELNNADRRFSPEYASGAYYGKLEPGIIIRLQSTDPADSAVRTMYIGWIDSIKPTPGISPDTATITAQAWNSRAALSEVSIPVLESVTYDAVLDKIMSTTSVYPPTEDTVWFLGVVGQSELGESTQLGSIATFSNFETGISTFLFAGDNYSDMTSIYGACQDTVGREYGRMWQARDGVLNAINRHKLISDKTVDFTFANTMSNMDYQYGASEDMANVVAVKAETRRETATQVVAGLQQPIAITAGSSVDVTYVIESQDSGVSLAVKNPITPAATTDYLCNAASNGTGTNLTSSITASILADKSFATRVTVRYELSGSTNGFITFGQLRGTKLDQFAVIEVTQQDDTSIAAYGKRQLAWQYNMDSQATADSIAEHILLERKDPRGRVKSISFKPQASAALLTAALTHSIFARIAVTETQTGLSAEPYFLIAETHAIAERDYSVEWVLESTSATDYWVLGTNTLGNNAYLGPL